MTGSLTVQVTARSLFLHDSLLGELAPESKLNFPEKKSGGGISTPLSGCTDMRKFDSTLLPQPLKSTSYVTSYPWNSTLLSKICDLLRNVSETSFGIRSPDISHHVRRLSPQIPMPGLESRGNRKRQPKYPSLLGRSGKAFLKSTSGIRG